MKTPESRQRLALALLWITPALWSVNYIVARKAPGVIGPYMLAKVLQCEVQLMFSYRKAQKIYFELVPFAEQVTLPRKDGGAQLQAYAQQYASALEQQAARAPLQWFNFYPYWASSQSSVESKAAQDD